ncbi:MAG: hypothetical protein QNK37_22145 [Acidobacteriota bacterium]|nr:hypothetical protein [Acidobacteriota bacterium]
MLFWLLLCLAPASPPADPLLERSLVISVSGDKLYLKRPGEALAPRFAWWNPRGGKYRGFFQEFGRFAFHPDSGRIAFVGVHHSMNGGQPTVFVIDTDDSLSQVICYDGSLVRTPTGPYLAARQQHVSKIKVADLLEDRSLIDHIRRMLRGRYLLRWTKAGHIQLVSNSRSITVDPVTEKIDTRPLYFGNAGLSLSPDLKRLPLVYDRTSVYELLADGKTRTLFSGSIPKDMADVFGQVSPPLRLRRNTSLEHLGAGDYLLHLWYVLDKNGRPAGLLDRDNSLVDLAESRPELLVYDSYRRWVTRFNLESGKGELLFQLTGKNITQVLISPNARLVLVMDGSRVKVFDPVPGEKPRRIKTLRGVSVLFKGADKIYFLNNDGLNAMDEQGNHMPTGLILKKSDRWTVFDGNRVIHHHGSR